MDHSHSPQGAAVSSASTQLLSDPAMSVDAVVVGTALLPTFMVLSHGAPSAMNQPTLSCGDCPHSHPPHHEGMRDQSLSLSSERDGDTNGLKTPTSAMSRSGFIYHTTHCLIHQTSSSPG